MTGKPTSSSNTTDVLVVGAGPTGLLLAGDLAAVGLSVTLVERRPRETGNLTRAFAVHARTLEMLDARGLTDELIRRGEIVRRMHLFGRLSLDLGRLRTRFPYLLVTPQYEVEHLLERRARSATVDFRYDTRLVGLRQDADSVTAEVRGEDDALTTLRARYLVGTDGMRSAVREALGLPFPGTSVIRSIVLADVRLAREPEALLSVRGNGEAFTVIASFGDGWYRVMGWNRNRQVPDSEPVELDEVREITRAALGTDLGMHEARWISRFHSDERQAPAYRAGRVFLAGDAAHVHSPAGGQGMNTGIQDAANLSWKIAAVLKGHSPAALLDTYESERHPVGRAVLRSSGALVRLAMAHTPLQRAARSVCAQLVNTVRPASAKAMQMVSGIGISYRAERGAHRLTGKRAPDLELAEGRLHTLLRNASPVLITPAGRTPDLPAHVISAHWPGARRTSLLVRPDGYIAWAGEKEDTGDRLAHLLGV
ncbi:FAD-dependent monooxygenase [Streptomyces sp. NBC_00344]|uniref:FAD-dependent monooxygenase n=1 Tax=Streptomyces sp. NBC_00344 TaxID=2975720 RepID=UPI002E1F9754